MLEFEANSENTEIISLFEARSARLLRFYKWLKCVPLSQPFWFLLIENLKPDYTTLNEVCCTLVFQIFA